MRLAIAALLIGSVLLGGCSRAQTYAAEPRLAPRLYGQSQYSDGYAQPDNEQPDTSSPSPSDYAPRKPSYEPASPANPLGPVPRTNSKYRYRIQEARAAEADVHRKPRAAVEPTHRSWRVLGREGAGVLLIS
jgi:hypothetical protein